MPKYSPTQLEYIRLRDANYTKEDAAAIVKGYGSLEAFQNAQSSAGQMPPAPRYSTGEAAALGAAEGATGGFLAEGLGALGVLLPRRTPYPSQAPGIVDQYRIGRDMYQGSLDQAETEHPVAFPVGEVGGATAMAALIPGAAPKTLGGAAISGGVSGLITGAGKSDADLTKGEWGEFGKDVGVSGGIGVASGAGGHAILKGIGAAGRKAGQWMGLIDPEPAVPQRGIEKLASKVGLDETENISATQTRKSFYDRSKELTDRYGTEFRPGQATGDPKLLELEGKAAQMGGETAHLADRQVKQQVLESAEMIDAVVSDVAANPKKIGRKEVSDEIAGTIKDHREALLEDLRDYGKGYNELREQLRGQFKEPEKVVSVIQEEIADLPANSITTKTRLQNTLEAIAGGDALAMRREQRYWSSISKTGSVLEDMTPDEARRRAAVIADALDKALDIPQLQELNAGYKAKADYIDEVTTETIKRILGLAEGDKSDTITTKLLKGSVEEIEGVFSILNKQSPQTAQNLRAQMIDDLARSVGKPERGSKLAERGITNFKPASALNKFVENAEKFRAVNAGDPKAQAAFDDLVDAMQRYATGPRSSSEGGLGVVMRSGQLAATTQFGSGVSGAAMRVYEAVKNAVTNEKALARAMYTTEGMEAFAEALRMGSQPSSVSEKAAMAMIQTLNRLGINAYEGSDFDTRTRITNEKEDPTLKQVRAGGHK